MSALAAAKRREHSSLISGHRITCPRCHASQDVLSYFAFRRPEEHEDELNVVLKCRAKVQDPETGRNEPCRFIFSLSESIEVSLSVVERG